MTFLARLHQIIIALSQLINTLVPIDGTWADEMFSAKCWRLRNKGKGNWGKVAKILDSIWFWQQNPGHCEICFNEEQQRTSLPEDYRHEYECYQGELHLD